MLLLLLQLMLLTRCWLYERMAQLLVLRCCCSRSTRQQSYAWAQQSWAFIYEQWHDECYLWLRLHTYMYVIRTRSNPRRWINFSFSWKCQKLWAFPCHCDQIYHVHIHVPMIHVWISSEISLRFSLFSPFFRRRCHFPFLKIKFEDKCFRSRAYYNEKCLFDRSEARVSGAQKGLGGWKRHKNMRLHYLRRWWLSGE